MGLVILDRHIWHGCVLRILPQCQGKQMYWVQPHSILAGCLLNTTLSRLLNNTWKPVTGILSPSVTLSGRIPLDDSTLWVYSLVREKKINHEENQPHAWNHDTSSKTMRTDGINEGPATESRGPAGSHPHGADRHSPSTGWGSAQAWSLPHGGLILTSEEWTIKAGHHCLSGWGDPSFPIS